MGIELIVTRAAGSGTNDTDIAMSEWRQLVEDDPDLRWRVEPHVAVNRNTGERIALSSGQAEAELHIAGEWVPFLRFSGGRLATRFRRDFDDRRDATRIKIAAVAKQLGAVITTDAGDEILSW